MHVKNAETTMCFISHLKMRVWNRVKWIKQQAVKMPIVPKFEIDKGIECAKDTARSSWNI